VPELLKHGRSVRTVFELLGRDENSLTSSLGWALAQSPTLLTTWLRELKLDVDSVEDARIELQKHGEDGGYTDIEICVGQVHVILEAKIGWNLPTEDQLERYLSRLKHATATTLVVLSECSLAYAQKRLGLPRLVKRVPLEYRSWEQALRWTKAAMARAELSERRVLRELLAYLESAISMRDVTSNEVYVVSLSHESPVGASLSWQEVVTVRKRYFHPYGGNGWPKIAPNYLGFRYGGQLQSIHHVESFEVVADYQALADAVPGLNGPQMMAEWGADKQHVLYTLGPAIQPPRVVKKGTIYPSGRVWCALDLLLTCETLSEARDKTKARKSECGGDE
jgi:hypothetical protein